MSATTAKSKFVKTARFIGGNPRRPAQNEAKAAPPPVNVSRGQANWDAIRSILK
jgi:hypothetical protein